MQKTLYEYGKIPNSLKGKASASAHWLPIIIVLRQIRQAPKQQPANQGEALRFYM